MRAEPALAHTKAARLAGTCMHACNAWTLPGSVMQRDLTTTPCFAICLCDLRAQMLPGTVWLLSVPYLQIVPPSPTHAMCSLYDGLTARVC